MKIGIFTFHCAKNYGAVLQAYGLQEYLRSQGHKVYIIDYRPKYLTDPYKIFNVKRIFDNFSLKLLLREILTIPIRLKRTIAFNKFVRQRLDLCKLDLNNDCNDFDAYVFGSDQIWNPRLTGGFDDVYFGKFPAAKGKLLLSYAASVGDVSQLTESDKQYLEDRLRHFSYISVRERELKSFFSAELGIKSTCVCDPVFLAGVDVYNRLICRRSHTSKRGFLLLFQLERINDSIKLFAETVAKTLNNDFIEIISHRETMDLSVRQSLSIEDFLRYVRDASYIITTSFHGTVFSLLYSKPFYTIKVNEYVDARARDLLSKLGVESRLVDVGVTSDAEVDSLLVQKELELYVQKSRCFLLNSLI